MKTLLLLFVLVLAAGCEPPTRPSKMCPVTQSDGSIRIETMQVTECPPDPASKKRAQ